MNAAKLKKDIERAVALAESIHDEVSEKFTCDAVPSELMIDAMNITLRLATLRWFLEHVSEGCRKEVSAK